MWWSLVLLYAAYLTHSPVDANIRFTPAPISCDPILPAFQGCLRGQHCSPKGICEPGASDKEEDSLLLQTAGNQQSSRRHVDNVLVAAGNPEEPPYNKTNNTEDQFKFNSEKSNECGHGSFNEKVQGQRQADGEPGEPVLARPADAKPEGGKRKKKIRVRRRKTKDGLCGSSHYNTVCANWKSGPCCSAYGFCGNSSSHCGAGCQSGPCVRGSFLPPMKPLPGKLEKLPGMFEIVGQSGVPVMGAAVMTNGLVAFIDKIENYTQLTLDTGQYAYSAEYDPDTNTPVPLSYKTNAFCSGGTFLADGRLISVGGNGPLEFDPTVYDGFKGLRYLERTFRDHDKDGEPWYEPGHQLSTPRWYASVQTLPDGNVFVASGSANALNPTLPANNNPTYELLDRNGYSFGESIIVPLLQTNQPYYMYPFLHVLSDYTMFIFVARSAEVFDVYAGTTVKQLPDLPGDYRTYPNTGGSVLLPLSPSNWWQPEVMICGGGSYQDITSPTDPTCGRIKPLAKKPKWEMELMPSARTMVDGILLPDGTVLWINGCSRGAQGFGIASDPLYEAWIYRPNAPRSKRWAISGTSTVARMYHSVALLLLDGTIMVAGSNPNEQPVLVANPNNPSEAYVTEFRVEIYTPHYLIGENAHRRPYDVWISDHYLPADGRQFEVGFNIHEGAEDLKIALYHGGFATHGLHMGHRMIFLEHANFRPGYAYQEVVVTMPPESSIAPPGPYVVYVVVDDVPSVGQFVMVEDGD